MVSALFSQYCRIYELIASRNAIGNVIYTKSYIQGGRSFPCRFDSLSVRSSDNEIMQGNIREEIRGMVYIAYTGSPDLNNNLIMEIDDKARSIPYRFKVRNVNPVYGFAGLLHHYECEVEDLDKVETF